MLRRIRRGELLGACRVEDVGVPQREVAPATVLPTGLLAEPVDRVLGTAPAAHRERVVQRRVRPVVARRRRRPTRRPACRRRGARRAGTGRATATRTIAEVRSRTTSASCSTVNSTASASGSTQTANVGDSSKVPPRLILTRTTSSPTTSIRSCSPCSWASKPVVGVLHRVDALEPDVVARVDHARRVLHLAREAGSDERGVAMTEGTVRCGGRVDRGAASRVSAAGSRCCRSRSRIRTMPQSWCEECCAFCDGVGALDDDRATGRFLDVVRLGARPDFGDGSLHCRHAGVDAPGPRPRGSGNCRRWSDLLEVCSVSSRRAACRARRDRLHRPCADR